MEIDFSAARFALGYEYTKHRESKRTKRHSTIVVYVAFWSVTFTILNAPVQPSLFNTKGGNDGNP